MAPPTKRFKHGLSSQPPLGQVPFSTDIMQRVHLCRQKLVASYLAQESSTGAWPPLKTVQFVQLALVKQDKRARHIGLQTVQDDIDEVYGHKTNIEFDQIFVNSDYSLLTLLEGRPGSGKTTLMMKVACDWARGRILQSKLVLFVRLRYLNRKEDIDLHDLLQVACSILSTEDILVLSSYIEGRFGEDVVFVLDGFDEYAHGAIKDNFISKLITNQFCSRSTVVVASRPAATQRFRQTATKYIEVVGFMREQVMQFIHSYFEDDVAKCEQLEKHLEQYPCLLYTSPSPRDATLSRMPSSA